MIEIKDSRIERDHTTGVYKAACTSCKNVKFSVQKSTLLKMLNRGECMNCKESYRAVKTRDFPIAKIADKWVKHCSGCGKEQAYTRLDHAKQSFLLNKQCKKCATGLRKFSANAHVGAIARNYNRYRKSAKARNIEWRVSVDDVAEKFNGFCALTGWEISMDYHKTTASLDRIDSTKGYLKDNIQWVHSMVNMSKNKYPQERFIDMCKAIASKHDGTE
jgi:hypothetical protein